MAKVDKKPIKYACFTEEQQKYYEGLLPKQRKYVDYRGKGYSKTQSYKMAGYDVKAATQAAYVLEARNKGIRELIDVMISKRRAEDIFKNEKSSINQTIDALAEQESVEQMLSKIDGADSETAKRIQFYRDIITGKIKTVKKTKKYNREGVLVETKIEEMNDVDLRMKARRELDKILGLNSIIDVDKLQLGDITINIVDASKKEEVEDSRNKIVIDMDNVEEVAGEQVIVQENKEEEILDGGDDSTTT